MSSTRTAVRWRRRLVPLVVLGALIGGIAAYRARALARAAADFERTYGDA